MPRFVGGRMSSTALEFGGGNFAQTTAGNGLFDVKQQIPFRASDIWPTAGKAGKSATLYTSSATFTVPAGVTSISVCCVGAGASGGIVRVAGGYTRCGGGGGGGAVAWANNISVTPGDTHSVTVGARGTVASDPGYYGSQVGTSGGFSAFMNAAGSAYHVYAGGGNAGNTATNGGTGGTVSQGSGYNGGAGGTGNDSGAITYAYGAMGGGAGRSNGVGTAGVNTNTSSVDLTHSDGNGYDIYTGAEVPMANFSIINSSGTCAADESGTQNSARMSGVFGYGGRGNSQAGQGAGYGGKGGVLIVYPGDVYKFPYLGIS